MAQPSNFCARTRRAYGYPDLGRAGLGNMLFPWARCLLWCRRHRIPMLPPRWFRLRIGPFLRRELDKRMYHRVFRNAGPLALANRAARLLTLPHLPEPALGEPPGADRGVYVFQGMDRFFAPLLGNHDVLRIELEAWLRPEYRPFTPIPRCIAVHVRRGDFSSPGSERPLRDGHPNYRIPIEWYVRALRAIRSALPARVPALVFSDGRPGELIELLAEPQTSRHEAVSAATDLLTMSKAAALVGSGSTFSRWATFLGQTPSRWYPGQRNESVLAGSGSFELAPEWDAGPLSEGFLAAVRSRI